MIVKSFAARLALTLSCTLMTAGVAAPAAAGTLQCVPFARQVSGIDLRGDARTWWAQAAGRYDRAATPAVGSVMSFKAIRAMPYGHVATVTGIVSPREVLLTHANWSHRGGIERDVRAVDVSAAGDWSEVRVWFAGIGDLGTRAYPVNGFIRPNHAAAPTVAPAVVAPTAAPVAPLTIATAGVIPVGQAIALVD